MKERQCRQAASRGCAGVGSIRRSTVGLTRKRRAAAGGISGKKKPQDSKNPAAFISIVYLRSVQDDYVINHPQIAIAYVINKHASARFDRGLDDSS
jgi:hypothetical protein